MPTIKNVRRQEAINPRTGSVTAGMRTVKSTTAPPTISASPEPMKMPIE